MSPWSYYRAAVQIPTEGTGSVSSHGERTQKYKGGTLSAISEVPAVSGLLNTTVFVPPTSRY